MSAESGRQGGCQCGAIRYRLLRAPVALYACRCLNCQKQYSSAFGLAMWVERDAVEFTGAEPRIYRTRGESGREKTCAFFGECGTRLYHAGGGVREEGSTTLSMKAGTVGYRMFWSIERDTDDVRATPKYGSSRKRHKARADERHQARKDAPCDCKP